MGFLLTTEQSQAVSNRGGGLLVSAAAGSGKTRVLVERLLDRVTREGRNIDEFLVITYTRAAAAELRSRIAAALSGRLAEQPGDSHLRRQATLVYKAQISTVHSFCSSLLRECGHLLDLSPDFRLCDESEAGVLMNRVLDEVMEKRYEDLDRQKDFTLLVDTMSAGRDDSRLMDIALDIYRKIQSHPHPERWLSEQAGTFELKEMGDASETVWGALLLESAVKQAGYWQGRMEYAVTLASQDEQLLARYAPSLAGSIEALSRFSAAAGGGWDAAAAAAQIPFPALGQVRNCEHPQAQQQIKAIRDRCKARMAKCAEGFFAGSEDLLTDLRTVSPAVKALMSLVEEFADAYAAEKNRLGLLDFSDLEHLAVRLLTDEKGEPTELAHEWGGRYAEIMVDEYQDTNEVQNAIFTALSREGKNLFLVGDVKQSIYRFRLADPTIFLGKYHSFTPYYKAAEGEERRVTLSQNFRSRPEILESANYIFRAVMSEEFGEIDYSREEELCPGGSFPEGECFETELAVLDMSGRAEGEDGKTDKNLLEARYAAGRIEAMLKEGFQITDGSGGLRKVQPGDIVVLLRSPGTVLHHYVQALSERSLPWEAQGDSDFFASTEVSVALSLLQIIDNPRQDVPLISVLRSPVFGFTADRLAEIRAGAQGDFHDALAAGSIRGEQDCREFLTQLEELRFGAGDMSTHQLIWRLYDLTNLPGLFSALPGGEERRSNLLTLYELARRFEESGHRGLYAFLTHLGRLRETGKIVTPPSPGEGSGVRILSIHRSKGLEFPVVFLCGLSHRFNREDMQQPILFHQKLGVGPKGLDTERMVEYTTLAREAVKRRLESEMMAEELRLLYVAMTRAKDKLIMTYAFTSGAAGMGRLGLDAGYPVEPEALKACSCAGDWILLAALCRPEAEPLREWAGLPSSMQDAEWGLPWRIERVDCLPLEQEETTSAGVGSAGEEEAAAAPADEELLERLSWTYPHLALAQVPSKLTATGMKGRFLDAEASEEAGQSAPSKQAEKERPLRRPEFAAGSRPLTPSERGTALHLAMQYLDFSRTSSEEEISLGVEELVARRLLTPRQGEAVDRRALLAFFTSPLGRELRQAKALYREFKFSILVPASDYYPGAEAGEQILLQGVVDCWEETGEGITLVDFKTDRVTGREAPLRAEEYRSQLAVYARALTELTGKPVRRRVLWFFSAGKATEL